MLARLLLLALSLGQISVAAGTSTGKTPAISQVLLPSIQSPWLATTKEEKEQGLLVGLLDFLIDTLEGEDKAGRKGDAGKKKNKKKQRKKKHNHATKHKITKKSKPRPSNEKQSLNQRPITKKRPVVVSAPLAVSSKDAREKQNSTASLISAVNSAIISSSSVPSSLGEGELLLLVTTTVRNYLEQEEDQDGGLTTTLILGMLQNVHKTYAVETFPFSVGEVVLGLVKQVRELTQASPNSGARVAGLIEKLVRRTTIAYRTASSSSSVDYLSLMVGVLEVVRREVGGPGTAALGATLVREVAGAFGEVDTRREGELVARTLEAVSGVLAASYVSPLTDQGELLLVTASTLKRHLAPGITSSSQTDALLQDLMERINKVLGEDRRVPRAHLLTAISLVIEKGATEMLTKEQDTGSTLFISKVLRSMNESLGSSSVDASVDMGELMVDVVSTVRAGLQEDNLHTAGGADSLLLAVLKTINTGLGDTSHLPRSTILAQVSHNLLSSLRPLVDGPLASITTITAALDSVARVLSVSAGRGRVREGRLVMSVVRAVREAFLDGLGSSGDVSSMVVTALEEVHTVLDRDDTVSRPALYSSLANSLYTSSLGLAPQEEVSGSLLMVRILSTVSRHLIRERGQVEQVGSLLLHLAKKVRKHFRTGGVPGSVVLVAVDSLEEELREEEDLDRLALYQEVVRAVRKELPPSPTLAMLESTTSALVENWTGGKRAGGRVLRAMVEVVTAQDLGSPSFQTGELVSGLTVAMTAAAAEEGEEENISIVIVRVCSAALSSPSLPPGSGPLMTHVMATLLTQLPRNGHRLPDLYIALTKAIERRYSKTLKASPGHLMTTVTRALSKELGGKEGGAGRGRLYLPVLQAVYRQLQGQGPVPVEEQQEAAVMLAAAQVLNKALPRTVSVGPSLVSSLSSIHHLFEGQQERIPRDYIDTVIQAISPSIPLLTKENGRLSAIRRKLSIAIHKVL